MQMLYLSTHPHAVSQFDRPQDISGASQLSSAAASSGTTEVDEDLF